MFSSGSAIGVWCYSCHLLILLSYPEVAFGHFFFNRICVWPCVLIRFDYCRLMLLLSSVGALVSFGSGWRPLLFSNRMCASPCVLILFGYCRLMLLLSSIRTLVFFGSGLRQLLFLTRYVCSLVFSSGSTIVVPCYSCCLLLLLSSLEVAFGHFLF